MNTRQPSQIPSGTTVGGLLNRAQARVLGAGLTIAACALAFSPPDAVAQVSVNQLRPHQVTYALTLDPSYPNQNIKSAEGQLVYEFERESCGWFRTRSRTLLKLQFTNGRSAVNATMSDISENASGNEMKFKASTTNDGKVSNAVEGTALRSDAGVIVRLTAPANRQFDAGGVDFPFQLALRILDAATKSRPEVTVRHYDGSEGGLKVYRVTTRIGSPTQAPNVLGGEPISTWPTRGRYFSEDSKTAAAGTPDYEIEGALQADGILTGLRLLFGEVAFRGTLTNVVPLPNPRCD